MSSLIDGEHYRLEWRRALRDALGGGHESQAVVLGRIPPRLVRSILTQMSK